MKVQFDSPGVAWTATWAQMAMRLELKNGLMACSHFGPKRLLAPIWPPQLYVAHLGRPLLEAHGDLAISTDSGGGEVLWRLVDWHQPDSSSLVIRLAAWDLPLTVEMSWTMDDPTGVMTRATSISHDGPSGEGALLIRSATSVALELPGVISTTHLCGQWAMESQRVETAGTRTPIQLESRAGKTGFEFAPYLAVHGDGYTCVLQLEWSGNWFIHTMPGTPGNLHVTAGLNSWSLRHGLNPGDTFDLPRVALVAVDGDLNFATQQLHRHRRRTSISVSGGRGIPVQFNSWFPHQGEPDVATMCKLADVAAVLGCETFVQDAGWYTTEEPAPDEVWLTRTGDWDTNLQLFPHGLGELADHVRGAGMDFGIWFEPEAQGMSSQMRRAHPDWMHHTRWGSTETRSANLGILEAREEIRRRIVSVLQSASARWMKWDMNTNIFEGGWAPDDSHSRVKGDPLIAHYRGLYQLQRDILRECPDLVLEMCAGGGGRFDSAIMASAHTNWMSDQTQAIANLSIHFGSQLAHPPEQCNDWLVEWPPHDTTVGYTPADARGDLAFRARVAMLGAFGVSAPLQLWDADDLAVVGREVDWYKQNIRPLWTDSDQYLLTGQPPLDGDADWAAVWYAQPDGTGGSLSAFRMVGGSQSIELSLPGLDPDRHFRLRTPEGDLGVARGRDLADGLKVRAEGNFTSTLIMVTANDDGAR